MCIDMFINMYIYTGFCHNLRSRPNKSLSFVGAFQLMGFSYVKTKPHLVKYISKCRWLIFELYDEAQYWLIPCYRTDY